MLKIKNTWLFFILISSFSFAQNTVFHFEKPVELTSGDRNFIQPVWSPDNQKIAFSGANYQGIWLMDPDGQNLAQISNDPSAGYKFSWSNNSDEILVRAVEYKKRRRKYLIKLHTLSTSESKIIAEFKRGPLGIPKWSSDNTKTFVSNRWKMKLLEVSEKASENTGMQVTKEFYNNRKEFLIFDSKFNVVSKEKPVTGSYLNAVSSPDGSKIAFELLGGNMFVCNIDGSNVTDLGPGERPSWAPDSKWLAYVFPEDDGHKIFSSDVYIIKTDGTGKQNITNTENRIEMNPNWSPDGKTIVCDDRRTGQILKISNNRLETERKP